MNAEKWNPEELVVTFIGVERRDKYSWYMCSRNCISFIMSIDIVFIVMMVMYQNRQVIVTSFGCCWYSGGTSQSPDCWSSYNVQGKMHGG